MEREDVAFARAADIEDPVCAELEEPRMFDTVCGKRHAVPVAHLERRHPRPDRSAALGLHETRLTEDKQP